MTRQSSILPFCGITLWPENGEVKAWLMGTPASVIGRGSGLKRSSLSSDPSRPKSKVSSESANRSVLVSMESPEKLSKYAWTRSEKRRARIQIMMISSKAAYKGHIFANTKRKELASEFMEENPHHYAGDDL